MTQEELPPEINKRILEAILALWNIAYSEGQKGSLKKNEDADKILDEFYSIVREAISSAKEEGAREEREKAIKRAVDFAKTYMISKPVGSHTPVVLTEKQYKVFFEKSLKEQL